MTDDLLPESTQARAIAAALSALRQAGIDAVLDIHEGVTPFWIALRPAQDGAAGKAALLSSVQEVLNHQLHAVRAVIAIGQAKQAPPADTTGA